MAPPPSGLVTAAAASTHLLSSGVCAPGGLPGAWSRSARPGPWLRLLAARGLQSGLSVHPGVRAGQGVRRELGCWSPRSNLSLQACGSPCPPRHSRTLRSPPSCRSPPTINPAHRKLGPLPPRRGQQRPQQWLSILRTQRRCVPETRRLWGDSCSPSWGRWASGVSHARFLPASALSPAAVKQGPIPQSVKAPPLHSWWRPPSVGQVSQTVAGRPVPTPCPARLRVTSCSQQAEHGTTDTQALPLSVVSPLCARRVYAAPTSCERPEFPSRSKVSLQLF